MKRPSVKNIDPHTLQLIRQIVLGGFVMLFISGLIAGVWYGSRLPLFTIDTVSVSGGETIDHDRIRSEVDTVLQGEYLGLVPRRFVFTYPQQAIVEQLQSIDRLADPVVETVSWQELSVSFREYEPIAQWCSRQEEPVCVFLDVAGYAYAPAPSLRGGSMIQYHHLSRSPEVDTTVVDSAAFKRLTELIDHLGEIGWYVTLVEVDQAGDAFLRLNGGGELKINTDADPTTTVENLLVIIQSKEFTAIEPGSFAYIDLRYGNKVFVQEEEIAASEGEAATSSLASTTDDQSSAVLETAD